MIGVLVVDDDRRVAGAHAMVVERVEGFMVVGQAHTGAAALESIARDRPDLVLLDLYLPDITGIEVIRRLAAQGEPGPDVIFVTAARDIESVRTAMNLGAFYYLVKPFSVASLREQLEAYQTWKDRLTSSPEADQEVVDELYSMRATPSRRSATARGLQPTVARVLEIVATSKTPIGASEVAEILGASRPTAQRCLATLLRKQLVTLDLSYGTAGRPEHRYTATRGSPGLDLG